LPPKPPVKALTRAQKLAKALAVCRKKKRRKTRAACEALARKHYGPVRSVRKTHRRGK
jgi:hypothetical protein